MKSEITIANRNHWLNGGGTFASSLCAVHCALMPLAIPFLPLLGLSFLANPIAEWLFFGVSTLMAILGWRSGMREHGSPRIVAPFAVGLLLLTLGRCSEAFRWPLPGVWILVAGGLIIAAAHCINWKLCRACHGECPCGCGR